MDPNKLAGFMAIFLGFASALSFSSLFFKRGLTKQFFHAFIWFVFFFLVFATAGWITGHLTANNLSTLSTQAGATLLLVLGLKLFIKGIKTKAINRLYDITQTRTLIGLTAVLNLDIFIAATAVSLSSNFPLPLLISAGGTTTIVGLILGGVIGKNTGLLFPNLMEIIAAAYCIVTGVLLLTF